jgi:glycosyltransferase involved in cell wall biosynthesis
MTTVYQCLNQLTLNGRFATRPMTGVDRVAYEIGLAISQLCLEVEGEAPRLKVLVPKLSAQQFGEVAQRLSFADLSGEGRFSAQIWEQFELPFGRAGNWILNLCNMGPLLAKRQVLMIHDAQVYLAPESYSFAFRCWYRMIQPWLARRASVLLTVSEYSRERLEEVNVFPEGKATVVYNGIDHMGRIEEDSSVLKKHNLSAGNYFLTMGSGDQHKNLRCAIEAAKQCPAGTPPLVVVGGNVSVLKRDLEPLVPGRLLFLERVSDRELKALYTNALSFVFPSITEGFGLPPLEAMYCGCPVIASTGGAIPEICGDAAYYADPKDPQAWRDAMVSLATDQGLRAKLKAAGSARSANYTWRKSAIELLQAIAKIEEDAELYEQLNTLKAK